MENDENMCLRPCHYGESSKGPQEEEPTSVLQPKYDPFFTANEQIIRDLLFDEKRYHSLPAYCLNESRAQAIWMRRALLNWLRDVCEHRNSGAEVLAHTAQLVDRFLHVVPTDKREYQLVGAACFLISSKLKEAVTVRLDKMVKYTDFSIMRQDILAKELTICISLRWDLTGITPVDIIGPVVDFLQFVPELRLLIRQSAISIFMKVLHVESINHHLPSYMAAACILYALQLTVTPDLGDLAVHSITRIQNLLGLEARKIRESFQTLTCCFEPGTIQLSELVTGIDSGPPAISAKSCNPNSAAASVDHLATSTILPSVSATCDNVLAMSGLSDAGLTSLAGNSASQISSSSLCSTASSSSVLSAHLNMEPSNLSAF